jgi:hypothetical protein
MYLIDKTYFRNKLQINGLYDGNNGLEKKLDEYISIYVIDFLQKLLGVDFEELNTNIVSGVLEPTAPQRWLDLINGKTYTKDGKDYVWKGLLYQNGSVKLSILANVVYCSLMHDLATGNGQISVDVKSSRMLVPRKNYIEVWNEIANQFNQSVDLQPKISFIRGVKFTDYYGGLSDNGYRTLTDFLIDFEEEYPNVNICLGYEIINSFDLC